MDEPPREPDSDHALPQAVPEAPAQSSAEETPRKRRIPATVEFVLLTVTALGLSVLIKSFLVQMFFVPSASMENTLLPDDRIVVQKISYWGGDIQRGDVVVFDDPGGWLDIAPALNGVQRLLSDVGLYPAGGHLVKRVIGVGGDHVVCCDANGKVTVNGVALDEGSYLAPNVTPSERQFDVTVPAGRLWVMGDNRIDSEDSRYHQRLAGGGTISEDTVVGKVWAIVFPFGRWHRLQRPATFDNAALDAAAAHGGTP